MEKLKDIGRCILAVVGLFASLVFLGIAPLFALGIMVLLFIGCYVFELIKSKAKRE